MAAPPSVPTALCPAPAVPALPAIDGGRSLDSQTNRAALLERDDVLRGYIRGLRRTVDCYRAQTGQTGAHHVE